MRLFLLAVMVTGVTCVFAQTQTNSTSAQSPAVQSPMVTGISPQHRLRVKQTGAASAEKPLGVAPDTPVVTLDGLCKERQANAPCKTVITRKDLDEFVRSFGPDASASIPNRMAILYARTLAFATLAEQQGLDKNETWAKEIEAQLKVVRARILASAYLQLLQNETARVTGPESEKYYQKHKDEYEEVHVRRLEVPFAVPTESGRPLERAVVKAKIGELRKRAVAGEDFNQLQQEAFTYFHIQPPPPISEQVWRRTSVQGDEAKAFDLNPGEVSEVLDLPAAEVLVKLESKGAAPLESVRGEIDRNLRQERMLLEIAKLSKKVKTDFNLQYLGLPIQPEVFGVPTSSPVPSSNPAQPASVPPHAAAPRQ